MIPAGSVRRYALGTFALVLATGLVPLGVSGATPAPPPASDNARTLDVSLPGPFNGCTYLDAGATPTTDAVLDLVRPSAFQTSSAGSLVGENGPIASAELTSLTPETVQYTIAPHELWSDGVSFTGLDLIGWWHRARALASVASDGYSAIQSMELSKGDLTVTAVFKTPYADWNLLFRDVEAPGTASSCSLGALVARPSLGPYLVQRATANRIVLVMNRHWPVDTNRFGRVVLSDADTIPKGPTARFVNYSLSVDRSAIETLSSHPTVSSHIGSSNNVEEVTFSPLRPFTRRIAVREALSWSIARQGLIDQLWGAVTFSPSVAASALYSQGEPDYPGGSGSGPSAQTTTTTVATTTPPSANLADCQSCALAILASSGFVRLAKGWETPTGTTLAVRVAVGPSAIDQASAAYVEHQWAQIGVAVRIVEARSEVDAALASASGAVDAAIFTRPTITAVSYAARSWSGPPYRDSFPTGVRSNLLTDLFDKAIATFNPVTASSTWLALDQEVMMQYWVRPLFTSPSLLEWSNSVAIVYGSFSEPGLLDQLPLWASATATATPS